MLDVFFKESITYMYICQYVIEEWWARSVKVWCCLCVFVVTDGITKWTPSCRCVRGLEVRQKVRRRRHCYHKGSSYCQPHQLSHHMDQAAPDRSFKGTYCKVYWGGNNRLEVTAGHVFQLYPQMTCRHFKALRDQGGYIEQRVLLLLKHKCFLHFRSCLKSESDYLAT